MTSKYPPHAGQGLHQWILDYTRQRVLGGADSDRLSSEVWQLTCGQGRPHSILKKEIHDSIVGAVKWFGEHPGALPQANGFARPSRFWEYRDYVGNEGIPRPSKPERWKAPIDAKLIEWIVGRNDLGKFKPRGTFNLASLFAGYRFPICVTKEVNWIKVRKLDYWCLNGNLGSLQWMVPSPCLRCGDGPDFKNDANMGERLWLIIEFDSRSLDDQAKLLLWLDRSQADWDLSMVVYSGGKSLHGWFSCVGKQENREIPKFFRLAASLGCDRMMRIPSQYTRLPLGWNWKTDRRQEILHWNEEAIEWHNQILVKTLERKIV